MGKNLSRRNVTELVLVAIGVVGWVLRKLNILYIPALTAFSLGIGMGMLGIEFITQKDKSKKFAGVLVLSFGLFNVLTGVLEIYGRINGIATLS